MDNFDTHKWLKDQYLAEAGIVSENQVAKAIDQAIASVDKNLSYLDFAKGVAKVLKDEYGAQNFDKFMDVLQAELGVDEPLNEEISDYEMVLYNIKGATADLDEGGPDEPFDMEVKLDSSLSGDKLKVAIRDAAREEMGPLYKHSFKKIK